MNTEELLQDKRINFTISGGDYVISCLNPEHEDNNPSLRVDKITGNYNCFSCGFSGNIFKLFDIEQNILSIKIQQLKEKIKKLEKNTLSIPLLAVPFEQSYRNIKRSTFKRFNAFTLSEDKNLSERIVFPVTNIHGEIMFFHARYINSNINPKYISIPGGVEKFLFPSIPDEIINGTIILTEGFFDMLNLWDKGLKNAVCCFGSSLVSKSDRGNTKLINKFSQFKLQGVNKIIIIFDADKAGRYGASKLEEALAPNYMVEVIELEDDQDPGSLNQKEIDEIREYLYEKNSNY